MRIPAMLNLIVLLVTVLVLSACSTAVGPESTQGIGGQSSRNSLLNSASFIDGAAALDGEGRPALDAYGQPVIAGTTNISTAGTITLVEQTSAGTKAKGSGVPPTTLSISRADGSRLSLSSPNNAKGSIVADAATGEITSLTFDTSASEPLDALARLTQVYQASVMALSADQKSVLETMSENQKETIKAVAPELFAVLKAAIGGF
jgi:hypothetical protein